MDEISQQPDMQQPDMQDFTDPKWIPAKRGLVNYRRALIASIFTGIGFGVIGAIMGASGEFQAVIYIALVGGIAGLVFSCWMVYGLFLYGRVPEETGARSLASVAMWISGLSILVEFYSAYLLIRVQSGDMQALMDLAQGNAQYVNWISSIALLVGFVCLVISLKRVAIHVGATHVQDMISSYVRTIAIVIALAVGTVVFLAAVPALGGLLSIGLLVFMIIALVKFLNILKALGDAIGGLDVSAVFS